jgi:hypothetical protein
MKPNQNTKAGDTLYVVHVIIQVGSVMNRNGLSCGSIRRIKSDTLCRRGALNIPIAIRSSNCSLRDLCVRFKCSS